MPSRVEPAEWNVQDVETGNGCFETMRAYRGTIFRLGAHLDRLYASAQFLGLAMPARDGLARKLQAALERSRIAEATVRVAMIPRPGAVSHSDTARTDGRAVAFGDAPGRGMTPAGGAPAEPMIMVRGAIMPPASAYRRGARLAVVPTRTFSMGGVSQQAKYSARLGSVFAVMEAQLRGADEALWLDANGCVTESTASNFACLREGRLLAPPCNQGLLPGVTRAVLFELARELSIPAGEARLTRHEVYNAQEAFLLSTLKEVLPVTDIDGRAIGGGTPGPVAKRLLTAFRRLVKREIGD